MVRLLISTLAFVVATLPNIAGADELTAMIQEDLVSLGYSLSSTDGEMNVETAVAISQFQAERGMDVTGEASPQLAGVLKAAIRNPNMPAPAVQAAAVTPAAPAQAAQPQQGQVPSLTSTMTDVAGSMAPAMAQQMLAGAAGIDPAMLQMATGGQAQQSPEIDPATMQAFQMQAAQMMGGATGMDPAMIQAMQMEAMQQQAAQAQQACLQGKIADAQAAQQSQQRRRGFGSLMRAVTKLGGDDVAATVASATADIAEANSVVNDLESAARDLGLTDEDVASCAAAQ